MLFTGVYFSYANINFHILALTYHPDMKYWNYSRFHSIYKSSAANVTGHHC